jgi:hypothetical protein
VSRRRRHLARRRWLDLRPEEEEGQLGLGWAKRRKWAGSATWTGTRGGRCLDQKWAVTAGWVMHADGLAREKFSKEKTRSQDGMGQKRRKKKFAVKFSFSNLIQRFLSSNQKV